MNSQSDKKWYRLDFMGNKRYQIALVIVLVLLLSIAAAYLSLRPKQPDGQAEAMQPEAAAAVPEIPEKLRGLNSVTRDIRLQYVASSSKIPVIKETVYPKEAVGAYQKFEASFKLDATYTNPFDPDDINVEGHFVYPDGHEVVVPAFYYELFEPNNGKTTTRYNVSMYGSKLASGWKVRFSSEIPGNYAFYITAKDSKGQVGRTERLPFTIVNSNSSGYVRVSATNPAYFENSADGSLFYGSGSNIPYIDPKDVGNSDKASYEYFLSRAKGNSNVTRVWITHWRWLEWTPDPKNAETHGYGGLNYYNQRVASMLDRIYSMAEQSGLKIMLTLDDNNELAVGKGYESWDFHPYSVKNGGPAASKDEYWTNPEVREIYKKKLRYIAARWGYSTSMWALNQWNDMSNPKQPQVDYVKEMQSYVHSVFDGWRPIVYGTNFGGEADTFTDYAQFGKSKATDKPGVTQETFYSGNLEWFNSILQEQLWEGLVKGNAARLVWAYGVVESQNAWPIFQRVIDFVRDIPLNKQQWKESALHATATKEVAGASFSRIIEVTGYGDINSYGVKAPQNQFSVRTDEDSQFLEGFASGSNYQGHILYGSNPGKVVWRNPPTFTIDVPESGSMLIRVKEVDAGKHKLISVVNGKPGPSLGWDFKQKTHLKPLSEEEQFLEIPLTKGVNHILLDIEGPNFVRLSNIYFVLHTGSSGGVLSAKGLVSERGDEAFYYIKNQTYTELYHTVLEKQAVNVTDVRFEVPGLKDGRYTIVYYDPSEGKETGSVTANSIGGKLLFTVNEIKKDLAVKIKMASN